MTQTLLSSPALGQGLATSQIHQVSCAASSQKSYGHSPLSSLGVSESDRRRQGSCNMGIFPPCLQSEIKVLTHFCKTEPRLGVTDEWRGGGQGAAYFFSSEGGYQRCEHCETTLCLPPKQVLIWGAFDCDHGSICIRSSWEGRRTCHISPTRVCSHQEQGRRNSGLCRHQKWQLS